MKPTALPRLALLALLLPLATFAHDDDDDHDEGRPRGRRGRWSQPAPSPERTAWLTECGSCHLAYPPALLPARSWKALLAGLDDHFGQNAELAAATRATLLAWATANAGRDVPGPTPLRITTLRWWRGEHDELSPSVYRRQAVGSPANCGACHPGANEGAFSEHAVRIPRDAPAPR